MRSFAFLFSTGLLASLPLVQDPEVQDSARDVEVGERLFRTNCAMCHGRDATGGKGPNLAYGQLRYATTDDKFLDIIENGIPGTGMYGGAWGRTREEKKQIIAYVRSLARDRQAEPPVGDPARGEVLYRTKGSCTDCHSIGGQGGQGGQGGRRGPELDGIGWKRSREHLRQSISDPGADVDPKWWSVVVTDQSGNTYGGWRLDEDSFSVRFLDEEEDKLRSLWKTDIKTLMVLRTTTMILTEILSPAEVDDLVAYLESLRGVP